VGLFRLKILVLWTLVIRQVADAIRSKITWLLLLMPWGDCDICMKQKILVINYMKRDKILLKPKVYDQEDLCGSFVKFMNESWPTFGHF
jgi:hypothetical protein